MKATITDVAKQAGVSMKTVSRVLNNEPNVAQKTRERVLSAASNLHYRPNLAARGLASSRSYLIALLFDNPSPSYITGIQMGAIQACREQGYHLLLEPMTMEQAESSAVETVLSRLSVDGVVLTPPLNESSRLMEGLRNIGMKHVCVGAAHPLGGHMVRMDDVEASRQMTHYLIEQGHRDIAFINGPPSHAASAKRRQGFVSAMKQAGLIPDPDRIVQGDFTFRSGCAAAEALLVSPSKRPTAIFASNDDMAAGVLSTAGRLGLSVPNNISVCGFDNTPIAEIMWPQLTTVAQPILDMGHRAAEILIDRNTPETGLDVLLEYALKIRESTSVPSV